MKIKDVYYNEDIFNHTARAILHGYRAKDKNTKEGATPREVNVVVIGPSEATSTSFVEQALRSEVPSNIVCCGMWLHDSLGENIALNGHILIMPEIQFMRKELLHHVTHIIEALFEKSQGRVCQDLTVHYPSETLRNTVRGAMFESWVYMYRLQFGGNTVEAFDFKYNYGDRAMSVRPEPDWKDIKDEAQTLTLGHLAPVIMGRIGLNPCSRNVFIDPSLASVRYLSYLIQDIVETRKDGAKVYLPVEVLEALFSQAVDGYKGIGEAIECCVADKDSTVMDKRTVGQL